MEGGRETLTIVATGHYPTIHHSSKVVVTMCDIIFCPQRMMHKILISYTSV